MNKTSHYFYLMSQGDMSSFAFMLSVKHECSSIFLLTAKAVFFIVHHEIAEVVELVDTLS